MEPLNEYEIQQLVLAMGDADAGAPIGSVWTPNSESNNMFLVLHHANMNITKDDIMHCVVFQAIPSGETWVVPLETFIQNNWTNLGFVWDRHAGV